MKQRSPGHRAFALAFGAIMPYHRFFLTKGDYIGVASWKIRSGDIICIILGATTPFVLRENLMSDGGRRDYTLVGECHVHGLMNEEGFEMGEVTGITLT